MSNVFRRYREPTGIEFWDNAVEIDKELFQFLNNEKNVPKRYRYMFTVPIVNLMGREWDWIVTAQSLFPEGKDAERILEKKKDAFQNAVNANEAVIQALQRMIFKLPSLDINKLDRLGDKLVYESNLLRAAKNGCKIQNGKKK